MKKYLTILCVALMALSLGSCRGRDGKDGRDGRDGLVNFKVIDLDVKSNEWGYSNGDNNNFFFAEFPVKELTWDIYDNGVIKVYREWGTGSNSATQMELPYIRHKEYPYEISETETGWGFYTETVDYEFTQGKITVYYTASDFDYELNETWVPEDMHFRAVLMW